MDFGLLGDYDAMPDLDDFGELLDDSLEELVTAAKAARDGRRSAQAAPEAARAGDAQ